MDLSLATQQEIELLSKTDPLQSFKQIVPFLNHEKWNERKRASELLLNLKSKGLEFLIQTIQTENDPKKLNTYCYWGTIILFQLAPKDVQKAYFLYNSGDEQIKLHILSHLKEHIFDERIPFLYQCIGSDLWDVREKASKLLLVHEGQAVKYIEQAFDTANSHQRFWSFRILARILSSEAIKYFSKFIKSHPNDEQLQTFAVSNLGEIIDAKVINTLLNFLKSDSFLISEEVFRSLCKLYPHFNQEIYKILHNTKDMRISEMLFRVIEKSSDSSCLKKLENLFQSKNYQTRYLAVSHLGNFQDQKTAEILIQLFSDEKWSIRKLAMDKITNLKTYAISPLLDSLQNQTEDLVFWSLKSLGHLKEASTIPAIASLLHTASKDIRMLSLYTILNIQAEESGDHLLEAFDNPLWEVRQKSCELFPKLTHFPIPQLLKGSISKNPNIQFWSQKSLENMGLKGAKILLEQIHEKTDTSPHLTIRNLRIIPHDILEKSLKKSNPILIEIEEQIPTQTSTKIIHPNFNDTVFHDQSSLLSSTRTLLPDTSNITKFETPIAEIFRQCLNLSASDIHIKINHPPIIRTRAKLVALKMPIVSPDQIIIFIRELLPQNLVTRLEVNQQVDASFETEDGIRLRLNVFKTYLGYEIAGRFISDQIPTFENLQLPTAIMQKLSLVEHGLVILTGPTGSGKTSTLAAMINYINRLSHKHIICIEDPVEFIHRSELCFISQREVLKDVPSFSAGIKATLREDPDIILVGELRDSESVETALTLAGTGHLVLTTLHAPTCTTAVEQLMDFFGQEQQHHIRKQISFNLNAIISQRLLTNINGTQRIPVCEVMTNTPAVKNIIRDGKTEQLPTMIETSKKDGMISLDQALKHLVNSGRVSLEEAWPHVIDQKTFLTQTSKINKI
ncbi:PilT/PilU family type 4a pilus ATPase [bacterium]|nr:PilT/PilU family type 4a pilus ATPase [bacterium]